MKVVTVGYFDSPSDYEILNQIKQSSLLNCERLIIYLFTDRLNSNLENNYILRKTNLHKKLVDLEIKSYINMLDSKSLYFLCQYDRCHYKIVLDGDNNKYKFEIEPTNLIYGVELDALNTP